MKLDQTDYDNIFYRVREKLLVQIFTFFTVIIAIFGFTTWFSARAKIDEITEVAVNKFVHSDEFQRNIVSTYQEKLTRFESQTNEISKLIAEQQHNATQLAEIPLLIDSSGLTLINNHGQQFRIEMGTANSGSKILFKSPYKSAPTVLLSVDSTAIDAVSLHRLQAQKTPAFAVNSTALGFEIPTSLYFVSYRWIALGQQEDIPSPNLRNKAEQLPDSGR